MPSRSLIIKLCHCGWGKWCFTVSEVLRGTLEGSFLSPACAMHEIYRSVVVQAGVWDVDGTGMQNIDDPEVDLGIRKVGASEEVHMCQQGSV